MKPVATQTRVKSSQRRQAGRILLAAAALTGLLLVAATSGGFRINMTPSEPLGLWRIVMLDRPPVVGDLVFICAPDTEAMRQHGCAVIYDPDCALAGSPH